MAFNQSQIQAIQHFKGPALVLAGPGSGKTTVITHRVKYLMEQYHINPSHILVITFTKAAAQEMQERFIRLMEGRGSAVTFGTFHSVFFRILKHAYHYSASNIIREEQRTGIIRELVSKMDMEAEDEKELVQSILAEISVIKNDRIDVRRYYSQTCSHELFQELYEGYECALRNSNLVDFDDMLLMTYQLLSCRQDICKLWQEKYRYILIDEFQDINRVQYDVIRLLAEPGRNLFIVGDDDQSIYRFRGARPEIMLGFEKDYPEAVRILLDINYRSTGIIVKTASNLISRNQTRFEKNIRANQSKGVPVQVIVCANPPDENRHVVQKMVELSGQGASWSDMAVLFRTNTGARGIVEKMMEYNIPFQIRDAVPNIYEHWIAQDILAYLELAWGDRSRSTVLKVINRPNRYISREALAGAESEDVLESLKVYYREKDWMMERLKRLEFDLSMLRRMAPFAAINYIRNGMGYQEYLSQYAQKRHMKLEELWEVLDILQESGKEYKTVDEWKEHIRQYGEELKEQAKKRKKDDQNAVALTTMHSSKGLEYKTVFILDVNEEVMPHRKAVLDADLEEERRLFYVAVTRAKENLYLYYTKERYNKSQKPSRYLEEMAGERQSP